MSDERNELLQRIEELEEFQNSIASRVPERYEDDVAQEAIIDRWLDDITKPRTVTTAEELDALPAGSAIIHDEGWGHTIAERHVSDGLWYVTGCLEYIRPEALIPATVLHETEPSDV